MSDSTSHALDAHILKKIHASFRAQGLMKTLGATLVLAGPGHVQIAAPIESRTGQQQGYAHAGLTFAIGDSAAGYAALSLMDADHEVVTAEMSVRLLRPAAGDRLVADGRVVRHGRRLSVVEARVYSETNGTRAHVALLTGTMVPVPLAPRG